MDKNYLSALEDTNGSLSKKISKIQKKIIECSSSDNSNKQKILSQIKTEFEGLKTDLRLMKSDITSLEKSENKKIWSDKYSYFKTQKEKLENEINKLKTESNKYNPEEDYMDINKKIIWI